MRAEHEDGPRVGIGLAARCIANFRGIASSIARPS
jgi:hypothetical protein